MLPIALTAIAAVYLIAALIVLAPQKPAYSHIRHTISEIGEVGAPHQRFVAFGLFLPVGLLLLIVALLVQPVSAASAALALCISIGYLVAAVFPCDVGSPLTGSVRQTIHNLGGAVEYIGGSFALLRVAEDLGSPFRVAGFFILGAAIALSLKPLASVRGIVQRLAEFCLFMGLAFSIWYKVSHSSGAVALAR